MTAPRPDDWRVCAVCARVLDIRNTPGGPVYSHSDPAVGDHPPVPVRAEELAAVDRRCDFCTSPEPGWELPVADFTYEALPDHGSAGGWAACDPCADLVVAGQWSALLRRAIAAYEIRNGESMHPVAQAALGRLYRQIRRHATGLPHRVAATDS